MRRRKKPTIHTHSAHTINDTVLCRPAYGAVCLCVCVCGLAKYQKLYYTCCNVGKLVFAEIKRENKTEPKYNENSVRSKNAHSRALTATVYRQTDERTHRETRMPIRSEAEQSIIRYNTTKSEQEQKEERERSSRHRRFLRSFKRLVAAL